MMPNSFVRLSIYLFAVAITVGCTAARVKDDKPLPVDDPEARGGPRNLGSGISGQSAPESGREARENGARNEQKVPT